MKVLSIATAIVAISACGCHGPTPESSLRELSAALSQHDVQRLEAIVDLPRVATDIANEYARRVRAPHDAMTDLRTYALAFETFATDQNAYPDAPSYPDLVRQLVPKYARALSQRDPWGTPYCFAVDASRQHYKIASAAADHRFAGGSCVAPTGGISAQGSPTYDPNEDILYSDGSFVAYPAVGVRNPSNDEIAQSAIQWRASIEIQLRRLVEGAKDTTDATYEPPLAAVFGVTSLSGATASVGAVDLGGKIARVPVTVNMAGRTLPLVVRLEQGRERGERWRIVGVESIQVFVPSTTAPN